MSARTPFTSNHATSTKQPTSKPQETADASAENARRDLAPNMQLNVSNIKGLTASKKSSTRSSAQQNSDPRQTNMIQSLLPEPLIESPQPHPAPMPFSQHLLNTQRPTSPANPRSNAPMPPPSAPAPSSFFSFARPASRAAHNSDNTHTNSAHNSAHSFQSTPAHPFHPHASQASTSRAPSRETSVPTAFESPLYESKSFELDDSPRPPPERRRGEDQRRREQYQEPEDEPPAKRRRRGSIEPHVHFHDNQHDSSALSDNDMLADYGHQPNARHGGSDYYHAALQAPHMNQMQEASVLQSVLGDFDITMFVEDYATKYQENLAKWENCTMAEWEAHGAVLNQKFVDLIDMVKDHMQRKLQLYASLKGVTQKHRNVLGQREQAIKDERDRLLAHVTGVGVRN